MSSAIGEPGAAHSAPLSFLSPNDLTQAIKSDTITIPTPGETFAALGKKAKPDWTASFRGPIAMNYKTRAQIALNLGGLIADGFIAIEAQDSQQVKNTGGDILKMAKALGVSENILARGNSINQFAENDEWPALQEELEATQNEVKSSMQSHRDQDLVILVSLGGWIRGTQVVTAVVAKNYDAKVAQVLRQPELLRFIHSKLVEISPDLLADPLVKSVDAQLQEIEKIVATPFGKSLSAAEVGHLQNAITHLMQQIQKKD
ncbi:MAG: hypothetical protein H0X40_14970 [Chthoniobacterales bacterium]|nr:hypothetical protein [Chthoniobacterales bacterium]